MAAASVLSSAQAAELKLALTALATSVHTYGFAIGLIFFGAPCVLRGVLINRSGFFPPLLGVLLGLAGLSYLVNSLALLLAPTLAAVLFPWVLLPALVGELALALYLSIRGLRAN